jgi:hypothetical protein
VLLGQIQQLLGAGRGDGTVAWATTAPVAAVTTAAVWVSTPMTTSTSSASMCIALTPCPDVDVDRIGPGRRTAGL